MVLCPCTLRIELSPLWNDCILGVLSPTMIPIYKKGKVRSKADSYRPISHTTSLGNAMERLMNARLNWFLENLSNRKGQMSVYFEHGTKSFVE